MSPIRTVIPKNAYSGNENDKHDSQKGKTSPLEPSFAVLWTQTQLGHITHDIWVLRQSFTYTKREVGLEDAIANNECYECTE